MTQVTLNAAQCATAWLNAFLASGNDEDRPLLNRTLCAEFFTNGVQFVATDGAILFRTWCAVQPEGGELPRMPLIEESPERAAIIVDLDKFAKMFMQTLSTATSGDNAPHVEISLSIEPHEDAAEQAPLGDVFTRERLTLRALGQELHCPLVEDTYPNWRRAEFGIPAQERMAGLSTLARRHMAIPSGSVRYMGRLCLRN